MAPEDHAPRGRLQHARHHDVEIPPDPRTRVVDDDHGAVVQIGHALVLFLAFLQDEHVHQLAREHDGAERIGEFVDVQNFHTAQLRDLVQVEVVRHDASEQGTRQLDQLHVDFLDLREVEIRDHDIDAGHLLDAVQDVEAAAAAVALERIGRIGDVLQLLEHELRDDERAVDEPGLDDVGNAAVDDDAGVENPVALLRTRVTEQRRDSCRLEPLPFAGTHDNAEIGEDKKNEAVQKDDTAVAGISNALSRPTSISAVAKDPGLSTRSRLGTRTSTTKARVRVSTAGLTRETVPRNSLWWASVKTRTACSLTILPRSRSGTSTRSLSGSASTSLTSGAPTCTKSPKISPDFSTSISAIGTPDGRSASWSAVF